MIRKKNVKIVVKSVAFLPRMMNNTSMVEAKGSSQTLKQTKQ